MTAAHPPSQAPSPSQASRISWVMFLRLLIVSALLGTTIVMNRNVDAIGGASPRFLFSIIVVTYALTIIYAIWYRYGRRLRRLGYVQLNVDAFLFGALVYSTGGVASGFTFLLHLWVIVAAIALGKRASYFQAGSSALILTGIAMVMNSGVVTVLPDQVAQKTSIAGSVYFLLVNASSLFLVAALVNILVTRMEQAGEGLLAERAEKKELVVELEKARHLAALGQLAATLAHEIRNPLSAISGSFQMLHSSLPEEDGNAQLAGIIDRELARMERLVDDILEYARPRQPALATVNLFRLCEDVVHLFRGGAAGLQIQTDYESDELQVSADANLIKQVLWNLLVNARQSVDEESGRIVVEAGTIDAQWAFVRISDNGKGVPADSAEQIFEAFFSTREQGMGLGLALCRRIVEEHNGTIRLCDSGSSGAVFEVRLPLGSTVHLA